MSTKKLFSMNLENKLKCQIWIIKISNWQNSISNENSKSVDNESFSLDLNEYLN